MFVTSPFSTPERSLLGSSIVGTDSVPVVVAVGVPPDPPVLQPASNTVTTTSTVRSVRMQNHDTLLDKCVMAPRTSPVQWCDRQRVGNVNLKLTCLDCS